MTAEEEAHNKGKNPSYFFRIISSHLPNGFANGLRRKPPGLPSYRSPPHGLTS